MSVSTHELMMVAALLLVLLFIMRALELRNKSSHSKFSLDDLLLDESGKASKAAIVMFGSFVLTSWVVVFQTINKTLTDLTFAAYIGAWVVPAVARIIKPPPSQPPQ